MVPGNGDHNSREGYGANKAAAPTTPPPPPTPPRSSRRPPPNRAGGSSPAPVPAGDYPATVAEDVGWLVSAARGGADTGRLPAPDDPYFAPMLDYAAEDRYLTAHQR